MSTKNPNLSGVSNSLQLGEDGPKIVRNLDNHVEVRTHDNTSLTKLLGETGTGANEFVTNKALVDRKEPQIITVGKNASGADFTSIAAALASITDNTSEKRYLISVSPGKYIEPVINLDAKPYVSVRGHSIQSTVVEPAANNQHLFKVGVFNEVSFLTVKNVGTGFAGIAALDSGNYSLAHKVSMWDCDIGILVTSATVDTMFYGEYIDVNGTFTHAVKAVATNSFQAYASLENYYPYPEGASVCSIASGTGAELLISLSETNGVGLGTGICVEDGAISDVKATAIKGMDVGIQSCNNGGAPRITCSSVSCTGNTTLDIHIEHPGTVGSFIGSVEDHENVSSASPLFVWNYQDIHDGDIHISSLLNMRFSDGIVTPVSPLLLHAAPCGILVGGDITNPSGLTIEVQAGYGYLIAVSEISTHRLDWPTQTVTLLPDTVNFLYLNENSTTVQFAASRPDTVKNIFLGRVVTNSTGIELIDSVGIDIHHMGNKHSLMMRDALGSVYVSGSIVSENAGNPLHLDVSAGSYYFGERNLTPSGGTDITFTQYHPTMVQVHGFVLLLT